MKPSNARLTARPGTVHSHDRWNQHDITTRIFDHRSFSILVASADNRMKTEHAIAFPADGPATHDTKAISITIERLKAENEQLRRLVVSLNAQLSLVRDPAGLDGLHQSH